MPTNTDKNGDSQWKPTAMIVAGQVILSGMNILFKLAANDGMDNRVLVAYRFLFGAAFMLPIAFFIERKKRPKLTRKAFLHASLAGLFGGSLGQNLYMQSLVLTSATFITAMLNLVPAITFVVAVCLRLENLGWKTTAGIAKVFGTLLGIGGAMLFTFYKGPQISIWKTNVNLLEITSHHESHKSAGPKNLWLGIILALLSCVCYSIWLIIQAQAAPVYPAPLSFAALMILISSILSSMIAICMQRDLSQWKLGWNIRLLAVSYLGIFGTAVMFTIILVVVRRKGPLFVAVFNPLALIIVGIVGSLVLDEPLHLGNLLGGIIIVSSLYMVLWGKSREAKKIDQLITVQNPNAEDQNREEDENRNNIHRSQEENV